MNLIPVYDYQKEIKAFVERGIWQDGQNFGDNCKGIGFANEEDGLVAGVIYHNYSPERGHIEISAFSNSKNWLTIPTLNVIFNYPFHQLRLRLVVARNSERNNPARKVWSALGAEQTKIPELHGINEAEMISVLRRDVWENSKFFRAHNGKVESTRTSRSN